VAARSGEWAQHFSNASCWPTTISNLVFPNPSPCSNSTHLTDPTHPNPGCGLYIIYVYFHTVHRKREGEAEDDAEDVSPAKRDRPSQSSKHCHMCNCRLELAVREVGKCKCGTSTFAEPLSMME